MQYAIRRYLQWGITLSMILSTSAAWAAVTGLSGALNLTAHANVTGGSAVTSSSSDTWVDVPRELAIDATASATDGITTNTASGSAVATWASADAGSVTFTDYGWKRNGAGETDLTGPLPDWTYTFVSDQSGLFLVDYDVIGSGFKGGLFGWDLELTGSPGLPVAGRVTDPTASGSFVGTVVAGHTYTATLTGRANIGTFLAADLAGSMDGEFDWKIVTAPVPEPANWGLMIAGIVAIGFARRASAVPARTERQSLR
jgi:hypothetical protein